MLDETSMDRTVDLSRLQRMFGFQLYMAKLHFARMFESCLGNYQLRPAEFSLLMLLEDNQGINQRQISDILQIAPPNLATIIARLLNRELIQQERDPDDRRRLMLYLTAEGEALIANAEQAVTEMETGITSSMSESELSALATLFRTLKSCE